MKNNCIMMEEGVEMEIEEETIQDIYEKAHKELYDNILIRDIQLRIENRINIMTREYLEKLGLDNVNDNVFEGEISVPDYDDDDTAHIDRKITIILKSSQIEIKSDNSEFEFD